MWAALFGVALVAITSCPGRAETNAIAPARADIKPGPDAVRIAYVTSQLLQYRHYSRKPIDPKLSATFFDDYLRFLDPQRVHFLQSDVAQFDGYRERAGELIQKRGDTTPGFVIFSLFMTRLEQRAQYVTNILQTNLFKFDSPEQFQSDRKDAPYPKDMDEAHRLWLERLRFEYLQEKLGGKKSAEIVDTLVRRYQRILKTAREWDGDNVFEFYLNSLARAYDPHTDYMGKSSLENFAIGMNLALFGIGAQLRYEDGYCKVDRLMPGGPAILSGKLKVGDRIVAVAQGEDTPVDIVDMPLNKSVAMIRGPKDTEVRLTVIPVDSRDGTARKVVSLIRKEVRLEDQGAKASLIDLPAPGGEQMRLGVIDLPSFYATMDLAGGKDKSEPRSTSEDVAKLLKKLTQEGVQGVILDLRRNGGGSLEEAVKLTGLFIKKGPVVQVRDPDGTTIVDADEDPAVAYDGPLIVLVSRGSASASEIVAGALQDYGRALIVGDISTHGKGTVQSVQSLKPILRMPEDATNDPGALKITIRKFFRASGKSTQLDGVTPDIVLPSVNNVLEAGEAHLDNPMPGGSIDPANYEVLNRVQPYLAGLKRLSDERVARSKDFDYVREDMERMRKLLADKTVSLNEATRLKEKAEDEARDKMRKFEWAFRPEMARTNYDISMKLAEQPGLPAPVSKTNNPVETLHLISSHNGKFVFETSCLSNWMARLDTNTLSDFLGIRIQSSSSNSFTLVAGGTNHVRLPEIAGMLLVNSNAVPVQTNETATALARVLAAAIQTPTPATNSPAGADPDAEPDPLVPASDAHDITLLEAEQILTDYIHLLPKESVASVRGPESSESKP